MVDSPKQKVRSVMMTDELWDRLVVEAARRDLSVSQIVRRGARMFLGDESPDVDPDE